MRISQNIACSHQGKDSFGGYFFPIACELVGFKISLTMYTCALTLFYAKQDTAGLEMSVSRVKSHSFRTLN